MKADPLLACPFAGLPSTAGSNHTAWDEGNCTSHLEDAGDTVTDSLTSLLSVPLVDLSLCHKHPPRLDGAYRLLHFIRGMIVFFSAGVW